jgi:hypothetical protein
MGATMCKRAIAIAFVFGLLTTLPARALPINPGDIITVSLSGLPSGPFVGVGYGVGFNPPFYFPADDSFRQSLFDGGNSLLQTQTTGFGITVSNVGTGLLGNVDNTGHLVFDQFAASADLSFIDIYALIDDGTGLGGYFGTDPIRAQFVVTSVPLPATLPFFAAGLGAMGLLCWRRQRKAQTVSGVN